MQHSIVEKRILSTVRQAIKTITPLNIKAGNSKSFYGGKIIGEELDVSDNQGVVSYHPSELIVTVKAGTKLVELQKVLLEKGQMLPFEPPLFSNSATIGGIINTAFSGSRRPFTGSVKDFVLGCKLINGAGEIVSFGGQVMKNVAGYDVSRLVVGSMGTLGVLLDVTLKVLPVADHEVTLSAEVDFGTALQRMRDLMSSTFPFSGLSYDGQRLFIRLSAAESVIESVMPKLDFPYHLVSNQYWLDLNEQRLAFFQDGRPLWRISVPIGTGVTSLDGDIQYDWGGSLRWLKSEHEAQEISRWAEQASGYACLFKSDKQDREFLPSLQGRHGELQRHIKNTFDPLGIFNRYRMYSDW